MQGAFAGRTPQSAMLPAPLLRGALLRTAKAGRLATAVRFGNRLAPLAGRHLTGQKGLAGRPLRYRIQAVEMNSRQLPERTTFEIKASGMMAEILT